MKVNYQWQKQQYEAWVFNGKSKVKLPEASTTEMRSKNSRHVSGKKWFCDKCFAGPFGGKAITNHRRVCTGQPLDRRGTRPEPSED